MRSAIRRFGITDLLLLIAGIAVGIGATRAYNRSVNEAELGPGGNWSYARPEFARAKPVESTALVALWGLEQSSLAATCMAATVLLLRLRQPRLPWRRLIRQPGASACLATVTAALIGLLRNGVNRLAWSLKETQYMLFGATRVAVPWPGVAAWFRPTEVAVFVLGWWLCLALTRTARRERSAIDRLGRLVGYYWLALLALECVAQDSL